MTHDTPQVAIPAELETLLVKAIHEADAAAIDILDDLAFTSSLAAREFSGSKWDAVDRLEEALVTAKDALADARAEYHRVTGFEYGFEPAMGPF